MIASVKGTLTFKTNEYAIVEVGGIGFKLSVPANTLANLGEIGDTVTLLTYLHVREDILALYGFADEQERRVFELLLNVSGVGPKAALNVLSATSLDALYTAVAMQNPELLTRIPGIGAKTAGRIVLELKGKIEPRGAPARPIEMPVGDGEVIAALMGLGYSAAEAHDAVRSLSAESGLSTEEKLLQALRHLAEHRSREK